MGVLEPPVAELLEAPVFLDWVSFSRGKVRVLHVAGADCDRGGHIIEMNVEDGSTFDEYCQRCFADEGVSGQVEAQENSSIASADESSSSEERYGSGRRPHLISPF